MVRTMQVATAFIVAAALMNAATDKPQIYRNQEFGITVPVPKEVLRCPTPENEHDHGPVMLPGAADGKGCRDLEHSRYIGIFASYNVAEVTKGLRDFLKWECADLAKGPCRPASKSLQVTGLPSMAARVNRSDGWVDIIVVTQAGKPDPGAFDGSVPSVNYDLTLHTRPEHMEKDLRVFRTVLATIRLCPAQ